MNYAEKALTLVQDAFYDERGMSGIMRQDAAIYAAIAQAQATRGWFVRIGECIINLAQVTHINYDAKDFDDNPRVEIYFAAANEYGSMVIAFSGNQYEPVADFLREILKPEVAAWIDLPKLKRPEPAWVAEVQE